MCTQEGNPVNLAAVGAVRMTLNGLLYFSCRWPDVVVLFNKSDLPFGGRVLFWWCQRAVAIGHEHETKERVKKGKERIEESGGNLGGIWLKRGARRGKAYVNRREEF
jgi:hypothetical protein